MRGRWHCFESRAAVWWPVLLRTMRRAASKSLLFLSLSRGLSLFTKKHNQYPGRLITFVESLVPHVNAFKKCLACLVLAALFTFGLHGKLTLKEIDEDRNGMAMKGSLTLWLNYPSKQIPFQVPAAH